MEESGDLQEKKEEYSPDVPVSLNKTSLIIHTETSPLLFFSRELNIAVAWPTNLQNLLV